jgi:RimJ/RimL family protein N-acetyltransferase
MEMEASEFGEYRESLIRDYAQDKVMAGTWSEAEALEKSEENMDSLLPNGLATEGHFVYSVLDDSMQANVGIVWLRLKQSDVGKSVWIYDILTYESFRRKGYGARTLELVEEKAGELGAETVWLHVFGHNHTARRLYERAGFETTDITMCKRLSG